MAKTHYDVGTWTPQESWRTIRNVRAAPHQAISSVLKSDRLDVFHMALEQSEQLFRSAAAVERETRPILLFYGLGQAGRALAAASRNLAHGEWSASGHGLRTHLNKTASADIWNLNTSVETDKSDLFSRTSRALDSAVDITDVSLGEAAANSLEFIFEFRDFRQYPRVVQLGSIKAIESWAQTQQSDSVRFPIEIDDDEDIEIFLQSVPALSSFDYWRERDGTPSRDHNGNLLITVPPTAIKHVGGQGRLRTGQSYRGTNVAIRALGRASAPVHPLLVWWLILYPLSMLARYEPRKWQQVLNVRTSRNWSQIEYLTDRALDAVPQLLAETLQNLNEDDA